jgi:hypothetical protein
VAVDDGGVRTAEYRPNAGVALGEVRHSLKLAEVVSRDQFGPGAGRLFMLLADGDLVALLTA